MGNLFPVKAQVDVPVNPQVDAPVDVRVDVGGVNPTIENTLNMTTTEGTVLVKDGACKVHATVQPEAVKTDVSVQPDAVKFAALANTNVSIGTDALALPAVMALFLLYTVSSVIPQLIVGISVLGVAIDGWQGFPRISSLHPQLRNILPSLNEIAPMTTQKEATAILNGESDNKKYQSQEEIKLSPLVQAKLSQPELTLTSDEKINFISECIDAGSTNSENLLRDPSSLVMVMGNTGAGKSTFINYVSGCKMIEIDNGFRKEIHVDTSSGKPPVVSIGHDGKSATFLPHIYKLPDTNLILVDNPGFLDNRGSEVNIANAVNVVSLMSKARSVSFLLCIEYTSLTTQRGASLRDLSAAIVKMFPSEVINNHKSFVLCVSKTPPDCELDALKKELGDQLSEFTELPRNIADNVFIYNPTLETRTRNMLNNDVKTRNEILTQLKAATPISCSNNNIYSPPLTDTDKQALANITEEMSKKLILYLKDDKLDDAVSCGRTLCQFEKIGGDTIQKLMESVVSNVRRHFESKASEIKGSYSEVLSMNDCDLDKADKKIKEFEILIQSAIKVPLQHISKVLPSILTILEETVIKSLNNATNELKGTIERRKEEKKRRESKPESPSICCIKKTDTTLTIKWDIPPSYTTISKYELTSNGTITSVSRLQHTINNLLPARNYDIQVRAVNDAGAGAWSDMLRVETKSTPPSKGPKNFEVIKVNDDSFTLSWEKPSMKAGETDITSYVVARNGKVIDDTFKPPPESADRPQFTFKNLKVNSEYEISIKATNLAGTGPETVITKRTSNKIGSKLKEMENELKHLDTHEEIEVHTKAYDKKDSTAFTLTHIDDRFDCDYKISRVEGPHRCHTFVPTIHQTGCSWRGNSQIDGRVIGDVKVYAKKCNVNSRRIEKLKTQIAELKRQADEINNNAFD
eukprot:CAMPEP_0203666970 /NCGR_PEP_ID=MMETSP0090-20130426/3896_1 /ASSEMBLY_ACC=CAM_ASM_001088 /TAXON_ID=426623 /ORGANISM="Chaetoceros affinis, Strain CCMP159" /LENGTH=920 /DNA_ID=CAMNT_0050530995 /DNA_START=686 /DNA_END=3448 /DNA_ORIENTATION=-